MKTSLLGVFAVAWLAIQFAFAAPMIDGAHDRVQTTFDPGLERIGTLTPRSAREVGPSRLAIGCECLPRGYGDFEKFKEYMPPLGLARVRLHAGWAKLEPEKGKWDFEWLDRQVNWLIENGMEPLLETSYGNPVYPGAGGASLSDGMPTGTVALAAWDNYVDKLAGRYPQVKNWACWNEPNNFKGNTPEMIADNNIRTAEIIKRHIPDAKIGMLVFSWCDLELTRKTLEIFKKRDALKLFHWAVMHDYNVNPDDYYEKSADRWAELIRKEAPHLRIWNAESGATSDAHYSGAISSARWNSELTQSKWNARRLVADLGHDFESLVFTMYDPCYDSADRYCHKVPRPKYWINTRPGYFMKRMGLVKCNENFDVTKVKSAYYTVQNIATLFDSSIVTSSVPGTMFTPDDDVRRASFYQFRQEGTGIPVVAFWDSSKHPVNDNVTKRAFVRIHGYEIKEPVYVDLVTGAIYAIPESMITLRKGRKIHFEHIPFYDAPAVITDRSLVVFRR